MQISTDVLQALSGCIMNGNALQIPAQLERKLYEQTNKVLVAAGGKWNRKAKAHLFDGEAEAAIDPILLTGEITLPSNFGYFPTPPAIAAKVIEAAEIKNTHWVLEPSAGTGALASLAAPLCRKIVCYELQAKNVAVLRTIPHVGVVHEMDFLEAEKEKPPPIYDRIVMNPPFARGDDMKHVLHALRFLAKGGRLVSITSPSWTFRQGKLGDEFRQMIQDRKATAVHLPAGSFKESGTMVNTMMITIDA